MTREVWNGCLHPASLRNASRFLEIAKEAERKEGEHYAALSKGFPASTGNHQVEVKSGAVSQFVNATAAFAAAVLSGPADYPAHLVDYATGLLHETTDFVNAERRAK